MSVASTWPPSPTRRAAEIDCSPAPAATSSTREPGPMRARSNMVSVASPSQSPRKGPQRCQASAAACHCARVVVLKVAASNAGCRTVLMVRLRKRWYAEASLRAALRSSPEFGLALRAQTGLDSQHDRLRPVLHRRARRRGARRALDAAGRARAAVRQHPLQRHPSRRAAHVRLAARAAAAQARGGRRRQARTGRRHLGRIPPHRRRRGAAADRDGARPLGRALDRQPPEARPARRRLPDVGHPPLRAARRIPAAAAAS